MHATLKNKLLFFRYSSNDAFTIVELLIIIVVLGILSAVIVANVNPGEITKKSRDTIRATDLQSLNRILQLHQAEGDLPFGSPNTVYLSLPDSNANCSTYTLPTLPAGWSYACKPASTYKNTDGTGWLPADLTTSAQGSSIPNLPIDPMNSITGRLYYSYISGNGWELNASLESQSNIVGGNSDKSSTDSGDDPTKLELGTNLLLSPWSFEFSAFPVVANNSGFPGWYKFSGSGTTTVGSDTNSNYIRGSGYQWYIWQENIPFNPDSTYKLTCRARQAVDPTVAGTKGVYCGWTGVAEDGVTLANATLGGNSYSSQHYHAMSNVSLAVGTSWSSYTGYTKGWGSPTGSSGSCPNIVSPCKMHQNVRYIRPLFILNYTNGDGITDLDSIIFTKQ